MSLHIEYQRFRRGESCTEEGCRARKFYIEDGKKFCQRGHEQAGFTQTQQDEDDWNAQGKKSRTRKDERRRVERILGGNDAKELYLQCYQLILWKQSHWLVDELGLPTDLGIVIRDLWELRLRALHFSRGEKSGHGSGTGTMFSSASAGDNTDTDGMTRRSTGSRRSRRSTGKEEKLPRLIESLALCYLGTLLLKIPVSVGDFCKWVSQDRLVYNRAIKEVPYEMRSKLPAHFHAALEIRVPLDGAKLHGSIAQLAKLFSLEYGIEFPKLNVPLLLFRYIKELCLPVDLYPAIRRLGDLLQMDFAYLPAQKMAQDGTIHPEIQLMSLVVIVTKLAHPFDNIERAPESYSDPSAARIDWSRWFTITAQKSFRGGRRDDETIRITDAEVWNLHAKKLDDYLNWYQSTWVDDRDPKISEQILPMFAIQDLPNLQNNNTPRHDEDSGDLESVQKALILQDAGQTQKDGMPPVLLRVGELYKRYRKEEEVPIEASAFLELAALLVGISMEQLLSHVFRLEVRLERWRLVDCRTRSQRDEGET